MPKVVLTVLEATSKYKKAATTGLESVMKHASKIVLKNSYNKQVETGTKEVAMKLEAKEINIVSNITGN